MANLRDELVCVVREFIDGESSLSDVNDWLSDNLDQTLDSEDIQVRALAGQLWTLYGEWSAGERDTHEVRAILERELPELLGDRVLRR
jgi:hypothetical protein